MNGRVAGGACCVALLVLTGCGDRPREESPVGPNLAVNSTNTCDPNGFNSLISAYFSPPQQQTAKGFKDAMVAALAQTPPDSAAARTNGFNLMREIAAAAKASPEPSASVGSELTVEVLKCIFDVTDTLVIKPVPTAAFFAHALDHAAGGGYEVRGGATDPTGPVQAVRTGTVIAAAAPRGTSTWDAILNAPDDRVLIYGEPGPTGTSYEWSMVRRSAAFGPPGAVVTTCRDDGADPSQMLTESGVGVLAYVEATALCTLSTGAAGRTPAASGLLARLARLGRAWLAPAPLAAAMVSPGITGGNAGSLKSLFDVGSFPSLTVGFVSGKPPAVVRVSPSTFPVQVQVSASGMGVLGVCVYLTGSNNNGTPTRLVGPTDPRCNAPPAPGALSAVTGPFSAAATLADFGSVQVTKTGGLNLTATAKVIDRSGTGAATTRINVKP